MIMDPEENAQIPTIDDFAPECMTELQEDTILDRKVRLQGMEMLSIFEWDSKA
jgi:hypothetical protein